LQYIITDGVTVLVFPIVWSPPRPAFFVTRRMASASLSREERITRCCERLAPHAEAVDILHASCTKVRSAPDVERFRKVSLSAGVFKERVGSKPGAMELLYSVGYEPMHGHLVLQTYDAALLDHAIRALETAKNSLKYREAKAVLLCEHDKRVSQQAEEAASAAKRAAIRAKVPPEPTSADDARSATSLCVVTIHVDGQRVAKRRFEADNTLADLHHYIRSLSPVPMDRALRIHNVTTAPARPLDPDHQHGASLYSLDLWPVSHVEVEVAA
jgi:hypothetical protein